MREAILAPGPNGVLDSEDVVTSHVCDRAWRPYCPRDKTALDCNQTFVLLRLSMSPSAAAPPSPQEIQRKLSVHSVAKPKKV